MHWPIAAACGLVIASVVAVAAFRLSGAPVSTPDAAAIATRDLRFIDRADGSIAVVDVRDGRLVENIVGENGFIRGTLRGLARERRRQGIGPEQPFQLVAHVDGRLTLLDPATGRRVDLESFGPTNSGAFARMLMPAGASNPDRPRS
jgi:putative photosynthetic complex assembly protein